MDPVSYLFSYRQKYDKLDLVNEKQAKIVESQGLGQAVVAGAGCGKTTTLVAKCKALMARNPEARFCAVSFTEKSVRDLREALTKGLPGVELSAHWVKTIHGLCSSILREFPSQSGLQGGERILLEDESARYWERSLAVLWTSTDNFEISEALDRLLGVYSRSTLEDLLKKLRSLESFGVEQFITRSFDRPEVRDLWNVFSSVNLRYRQAKNREGVLDFNDLETRARKALEFPEVRSHYQGRFDLVLVDEFQDTNPIQGEILERFVRPDYSNLTIVGDPKQSIYRFRDADVSVFQDLVKKLPELHLLDINYRSRPSIIRFVNEVCAPVFELSDLPYEPLSAGRDQGGAEQAVIRVEWETEDDLARFFLSQRMAGVDFSEFTVLVRSLRKEKTRNFLAALEKHRIPFLLGSGGRFYEDPRVKELVAFLKGWLSPGNLLSQATALRSPWIGIPDATLHQWAATRGDSGYLDRFFRESDHPVAVALREGYLGPDRISRFRPGMILARLLELETLDEQMVQPLCSLWHKCEELSRQGRRFHEIVQTLAQAVEDSKIEREVPAPAEKGMLRIMTVHGSKGLQFPRVVLLDFDGEYRGGGSADLIWDRNRGVHLFERDEDGQRLKDGSSNEFWSGIEKQAAVAESKRVFYVALTRPQEQLILGWKKEVKVRKAAEHPDYRPGLTDNWREWVETVALPPLWEPVESALEEVSRPEVGPYVPVRIRDFDPRPYRARHSPSEWLVLSLCPLRYRWKFWDGLDDAEAEQKILPDSEVSGAPEASEVAEQGKRIHSLLEHEDWEGLRREFGSAEIADRTIRELEKALGRTDDGIEVYPELGFEVPLSAREGLVGMMDRLEVDRTRKTLRVVDYKFTARPKSAQALIDQYSLQIRLYAWAASHLVEFIPERLEGAIAHFSRQEGLQWIPLPGMNRETLEVEVQDWFQRSRIDSMQPSPGDHCRFCEFRERCPVKPGQS